MLVKSVASHFSKIKFRGHWWDIWVANDERSWRITDHIYMHAQAQQQSHMATTHRSSRNRRRLALLSIWICIAICSFPLFSFSFFIFFFFIFLLCFFIYLLIYLYIINKYKNLCLRSDWRGWVLFWKLNKREGPPVKNKIK